MKNNKKAFALMILLFPLIFVAGCLKKNETVKELNKILNLGNAALQAKQYDKAIEFYDSGLAVIPKEPVFLSNKATALRLRAVDRYNEAIRLSDQTARAAAVEKARNDFQESANVSKQSVVQFKGASMIDSLISESFDETKLNAFAAHADSMRLLAVTADKTKAMDALEAFREYLAIEPDGQKKLKAQLEAGKMLIDTFNGEKAVIEYESILKENPNQPDALFGIGSALAQTGKTEDVRKAKLFFEKFINQAPAGHPSIATAKEILTSLSSQIRR